MKTLRNQRPNYDIVVIGARCAGAATAMLLARRGLQVLAVDRGGYGTDTLSTHALMRGGILQLNRWGLLEALKAAGTPTVRATSFHYADEEVEVLIKPQGGMDGLYAPRRTVIDKLLVDAARESGAEVIHRVRLIDLTRNSDGRVNGVVLRDADGTFEVPAGLVIGADGMRSTVAKLVDATPYKTGNYCAGIIFCYWAGLSMGGYHWYYRPGVSIGAIPTNDGLTCVFVGVPSGRFQEELRLDVAAGYQQVLKECNAELAASIANAQMVGSYQGFPGHVGFFRPGWGPGWALVGDAGYFKDPLTAHGITDALIDAEYLARAVANGSDAALADYQSQRDARCLGLFEVTDAVASFEWDLEQAKHLHRQLSVEMKQETAGLAAFD